MSTEPSAPDRLGGAELRAMWSFDDPEGSEKVLRSAADAAATLPGRRAELLTQVARALGLQERFEEAHRLLDSLDPPTPAAEVRASLERGRLLRDVGDASGAAELFGAARVAAGRAGLHGLEVDAIHMLALVQPERAAEWAERGLAIVGASTDPELRRWAIALENNRGWDLFDEGRAGEALGHFEAAHAAALELGGAEAEQVGRWAIGRCLRELGRSDEALALQRELLRLRPDDPFVREEISLLTDAADPQ